MAAYEGSVVFVHPHDDYGRLMGDGTQGVHYPVGDDGHPDLSRPLFYDAGAGGYRDKTDEDPSHHDAYHVNHVELQFPGQEPIEVTEAEAEAIKAKLAELRGEQ